MPTNKNTNALPLFIAGLGSAEAEAMNRWLVQVASAGPSPKFSRDPDYTHERLYRTIAGVIVCNESYRERLAHAQLMMIPLGPSDFPRELRRAFTAIVKTPAETMSEGAAGEAIRALLRLFFTVSEQVVNGPALGGEYEQAAWCLLEAQEGRPAPLRQLRETYRRQGRPLPASVVAFRKLQTKGLVKKRRGAGSQHPSRVIGMARMVKDRLEFQRLDTPTASLNQAATHIGELIGIEFQTPKTAYRTVYGPVRAPK